MSEGRASLNAARFETGDIVLCDDRLGWIYGWPNDERSYVYVIFFEGDGQPIGEPLSAISSPDGLWRCRCPRFWEIATAAMLSCEKCGATRG